jgi:hypothetical protein
MLGAVFENRLAGLSAFESIPVFSSEHFRKCFIGIVHLFFNGAGIMCPDQTGMSRALQLMGTGKHFVQKSAAYGKK